MKSSILHVYAAGLCLFLALTTPSTVWGHCAWVTQDVTFFFGIETDVPDPNHPITVDRFHTDLELSFRENGWSFVVSHDGSEYGAEGLDIPPQEALLYGNPNSRYLLPSIPPDFEFIGAQPNEPFWILPQNVITEALALGIAAEFVDAGALCTWNPNDPRGATTRDRWIQMQLLDVRGPADAHFAMWQADGFSPPVVFLSTYKEGITADDVYYISAGSHVHMNWGFTRSGVYEIDFRVGTVIRCDESLTADWAPLGNEFFNGDCVVDFQDFALLSTRWLQLPDWEDLEDWTFIDPADPVDVADLAALSDQWLDCGYPGCHEEVEEQVVSDQ
jgi:surface-anchored protein